MLQRCSSSPEADAAAIRAVYEQRGEFSAAVELRRLFPGITDNAQAQECARTIASWKPLRPVKRLRTVAPFSLRATPFTLRRRPPVLLGYW